MVLVQLAYAVSVIGAPSMIAQLGACKPYQKEVNRSGLLTKLQDKQQGRHAPVAPTNIHPVFGIPGGKIRHEDPDGTITLYAKSIKHLMNHIIHALENGERDLFVEQILSEITVAEFHERGLDPGIAFDELVKHRRDVYRLFHFMPMGERTPGLYPKSINTNMFRLEISRPGHPELLWIGLDASFEQGNYKLRWFVR